MLAGASSIVAAENSEIGSRRAAARVAFTDDEIKEGFFKIAFGAELQLDKPAEKIRKFDEPVRIFVDGEASPDRRAEIAAVINDIRTHINHLDLALTDDRQTANFTVVLVPDRKLNRAIRARHGKGAGRQIEQSLNPQCLSGIGQDKTFRIRRAEAILPIDAGDFTFYDCAYEELLQGLGPINDDATVPWTMSNDDVQMGFFDVYDQFLLNILYDPRIRPGMTKADVEALMPELLRTARSWIANAYRLDRSGELERPSAISLRPSQPRARRRIERLPPPAGQASRTYVSACVATSALPMTNISRSESSYPAAADWR
jgi:hypothetical protein